MIDTKFFVPNDAVGELFMRLAKKFLNKNDYKLVKRGRNPNRVAVAKELGKHNGAFHDSIPLKHSTYYAVYIYPKKRR
jgi:hypothetical protein